MYIVTFYSFKGGVGRTMTMMNVAYELVASGASVLLVDFDLEAPGLETFLPSGDHSLGIVDFINDFMASNVVPDVRRYVRECHFPPSSAASDKSDTRGNLWLMGAGSGSDAYGSNLAKIDWQSLYRDHEGFLLIEDLRKQWEEYISPDYVLIDSRTGYTDESGICTRQLPDHTIAMFFLNNQNLTGMARVFSDIRHDTKELRRNMHVQAVASNVPDIDDEADIVQTFLSRFKDDLGVEEISIINHYESLDLINQRIFTLTRPNTRLARQYRSIVSSIREHNKEDRIGVLNFLKSIERRQLKNSTSDVNQRVMDISTHHASDSEVLLACAKAWMELEKYPESIQDLTRIVESGSAGATTYRLRAISNALTGNQESMRQDLNRALQMHDSGMREFMMALRVLNKDDEPVIKKSIYDHIQSIDEIDKVKLIRELLDHSGLVETAMDVYSSINNEKLRADAETDYVLGLIHLRRYAQAMDVIGQRSRLPGGPTPDQFNFAMAEWGATGSIPEDLFRLVLMSGSSGVEDRSANYLQCLGISHWACGEKEEAMKALEAAERKARKGPDTIFSAWSYLYVSPETFAKDVEEVRELVGGSGVRPAFMMPLFVDIER